MYNSRVSLYAHTRVYIFFFFQRTSGFLRSYLLSMHIRHMVLWHATRVIQVSGQKKTTRINNVMKFLRRPGTRQRHLRRDFMKSLNSQRGRILLNFQRQTLRFLPSMFVLSSSGFDNTSALPPSVSSSQSGHLSLSSDYTK